MDVTSKDSKGTSEGFGADNLVANAKVYKSHKAIVDAASRYDNVDDAIAGLESAWTLLQDQIENGAGFTPDVKLGFGSDNARVIAETLTGVRNSVGSTRKAFKELGS
jgi:hypothetical protein